MSKRNRLMIIILVVQAAILVAGKVVPEGEGADNSSVVMLPDFDTEQVTKITIHGTRSSTKETMPKQITLVKKGDAWGMANADDFPVKSEEVNKALGLLKGLRSRTQVLEKSTYHDKLQVSETNFQRKVEVESKGQSRRFYIGSSPSFKTAHVRLDGRDAVYQVSDLSSYDLDVRPTKWVERSYLNIDSANIWSMVLKNAKGTIQLERSPEDGSWLVVGLEGTPKDTDVQSLLNKAGKVNLEAPVGRTMLPTHGLEAPLAKVTVMHGPATEDGNPPPNPERVELLIGAKAGESQRHFAKASNQEYVVEVASWAVKPLLEKAVSDLAAPASDSAQP